MISVVKRHASIMHVGLLPMAAWFLSQPLISAPAEEAKPSAEAAVPSPSPPRAGEGLPAIKLEGLGLSASFSAQCKNQYGFIRCDINERDVAELFQATPTKEASAPSPAKKVP